MTTLDFRPVTLAIGPEPSRTVYDVNGIPVAAGDKVAALSLRGEWTVKATDRDTAIIMQTDAAGSRCTICPTRHLKVLVP